MRRIMVGAVAALAVLLPAACGEDSTRPPAPPTIDSGPRDAGGEVDAGAEDAGTGDAGTDDAGSGDAGVDDAGIEDAGATDAGLPDAGRVDAGPGDAGLPVDAGSVDLDIRSLQQGLVPPGSPVRVSGVVTGIRNHFQFWVLFVQEPSGDPAYSAIQVRVSAAVASTLTMPSPGDLVTVWGTLLEEEQSGFTGSRTTISFTTDLQLTGAGALPVPVPLSEADLLYSGEGGDSERWESVLVRVQGVTVASVEAGNEFTLGGGLKVDDLLYSYAPPAVGDTFQKLTGPIDFWNGTFRLLPRSSQDLVR